MPNFSKTTMARVGRLMNSGEAGELPPLAKLARSGGFGRKAIYNWSLPETDPQHRAMPPLAKRMIAMLAYFSAAGLLTDKRLEEIVALETTFENEKDANLLLRRMRRVIGGGKGAKAAPADAPEAAEDDGLDEVDDVAGLEHGHVAGTGAAGQPAQHAG